MPTRTADLDTRERLLRAGEALAGRGGFKALTVRAVAAKAGAHLGSFVHHFGTRDAFVAELIERWYQPMFARLQLAADAGSPPLQALRDGLMQFTTWVQEHRAVIARVLVDAAAGEAAAQRFVKTLDARHPALLLQLVARAQAAGALRRGEPMHQLLFLVSTLALPTLALHLFLGQRFAPKPLAQALAAFAFDAAAARERLEWALRGLAPEPVR